MPLTARKAFTSTSPACRARPNAKNSKVKRFFDGDRQNDRQSLRARSRPNWPPNPRRSRGSWTVAGTWPAPRERSFLIAPRMFVRTEIWRMFSRRAMILAPLTTWMHASWESGTRPPSWVGTRILPMVAASARDCSSKRTVTSKRFSPSKTVLIGLPPIAISITSSTSRTLMP